jgi:hypothetical protein
MAGFGVVFDANMDEWAAEFAKVANHVPAVHEMELVLQNMFDDMQSITHVVTGSLRGSGKLESDIVGDLWVGRIGEGGSSPGFPHDPVEYAETEIARGGEHDFLRNAPALAEAIGAILEAHLDGLA